MIWWIIIPSALFGFFMLSRGKLYSNFFSEGHLDELAKLAKELHQESLQPTEASADPKQPPHRISSAGLLLVYTLRRTEPQYIAHLSLSYRGGWFASFAAGIFIAFLRRVLGLPVPCTLLGVSANGVYHAEWTLDAPPTPNHQSAQELYPAATEEGRQLASLLSNRIEQPA
jgi:hypothetical protein